MVHVGIIEADPAQQLRTGEGQYGLSVETLSVESQERTAKHR